jgi:hypothetical protein
MNFQKALGVYIMFIVFIKAVFGISTLSHVYLTKIAKTTNVELDEKFLFWRERAEFVFIASVSIILILTFNPLYKFPIELSSEMKFLFFILGMILISGAEWKIFVKKTPFLHLQEKK